MKFRHVNPHNLAWLVPGWAAQPMQLARELDDILGRLYQAHPELRRNWTKTQGFWVVVNLEGEKTCAVVKVPDENSGSHELGRLFIEHADWVISLPVNEVLKGSSTLEGMHCFYYHSLSLECDLGYFGITKQRWFDRYAQHESSAARGSPFLFHRALREHSSRRHYHTIILAGISEDAAMEQEERFVALATLYPLGLNMIPGGHAGMRYLHKLGLDARTAAQRDTLLETLSAQPDLPSRPNPLCAARWEQDQDFVERVICGHSGRLTVEQVRQVRAMAAGGASASVIAGDLGYTAARIRRVATGSTYRRIAG